MYEPTAQDYESLAHGDHTDPHRILGAHPARRGSKSGVVVRAFHPDAQTTTLIRHPGDDRVPMEHVHGGVFEAFIPGTALDPGFRYEFEHTFEDEATWRRRDPYRFLPTLGELDLHYAGEGRHWRLYEKLGAQVCEVDGVRGVSFAVWAPNARRVSVVGNFNHWNGLLCPMRSMGSSGLWELFIPELGEDELYKFEVKARDGRVLVKLDPFAFRTQLRPDTAAMTWSRGRYRWRDAEWVEERPRRDWLHEPMLVYEVHLGSWMRSPDAPGKFMGYRDLAPRLVDHCLRYNYNFVEFLPLAEHPLDESWGYQVTGYFAPTSRYGSPDDLKYLIDSLHRAGIGVIIDWVPAHFPRDDFALREFDGTPLYEHADPRRGEHKDWGTLIFDFGRNEVSNFLISNALFWLDEYHIDGLRVDAVASMLYLDYSRQGGEWEPNQFGGRENLEAIEFVRRLNEEVHGQFPGAFTVAEESTSFTGVSRPTYVGGLGFTFKWNMGWMNDTLSYFQRDSIHRSYHHNDLTFSMIYAYSENFVLPISHDEVVHGKGSLLGKMPGDDWVKFANYRLFLGYMFTHPGKKLLFMGCEFAQGSEWKCGQSLDWHEAGHSSRIGVERLNEDLGRLYRREPALWRYDVEPRGFTWIDCSDWRSSVLSFVRWGEDGDHLVVICNFTPVVRPNYRIGVPWHAYYEEVLNTDSRIYGGSNVGNDGGVWSDHYAMHGQQHSMDLMLPPMSCLVFKPRAEG